MVSGAKTEMDLAMFCLERMEEPMFWLWRIVPMVWLWRTEPMVWLWRTVLMVWLVELR